MTYTDKLLPVVGRLFARGKRQYFSAKPGVDGVPLTNRLSAIAALNHLQQQLLTATTERDEALARSAAGAPGTSTTTTVDLEVTLPAFAEIAGKLRAAGYDHAVTEAGIDMTGISLACGAPAGDPSPDCDPINLCQPCRCKFARGGR